ILRPAFAAVRRAGEVGTGLAAAVHHHDRIGMAAPRRDHELDVHLPDRGTAFDRRVDLAPDEEVARACEHERPALLRRDGRGDHQRRRYRRRAGGDLVARAVHAFLPFVFCRSHIRSTDEAKRNPGRRSRTVLRPMRARGPRRHACGSKAKPDPLRTMVPKPGKSRWAPATLSLSAATRSNMRRRVAQAACGSTSYTSPVSGRAIWIAAR